MARIRTIKPEFWSSEQIMDCSPMARLLFIGLWNFCDDGGNHSASAKTIKAEIFPSDDITSSNVQGLLDELSSNNLITLYTAENKDFYHVTGWHHQKIDRPTYKHPPFIEANSEPTRRVLDDHSTTEGNGMECNGREGIGNGMEGNGSNDISITPSLISKTMREFSIDAAPHEPPVIELSKQGVSIETIRAACQKARDAKPNERLGSAYVIGILKNWAKQADGIDISHARPPDRQQGGEDRSAAYNSVGLGQQQQPAMKDINDE